MERKQPMPFAGGTANAARCTGGANVSGWRDSQMSGGPAWIKTAGFDVVAQPGQAAPVENSRVLEMLQALLADRFHVRWHEEVREGIGYALRAVAGGPKLAPAKEGKAQMQ